MKLPVEDDFNDILGKAQKGLGISTEDLAERAGGLGEKEIRDARRGDFDETVARRMAKALDLNEEALAVIGRRDWYPEQPGEIKGFERICTPFYDDRHVNAYVAWSEGSGKAVVFDTGTDESKIAQFLEEKSLQAEMIFLTHAHRDHVTGVDKLAERYGCPILGGEKEANLPSGARKLKAGETMKALDGELKIEVLETSGHTSGGVTFLLSGLPRKVAVVGDALFAGSVGGANVSYEATLEGLEKLLQLPPDTVLAPGHGPYSTVEQERVMNCFHTGG